MTKLRINRALAQAGVASRRGAETLIRAGRVKVNGKAVTDLATTVDTASDVLTLDGKRLSFAKKYHYYMMHKPRGVVSTMQDERGRPCVGDSCRELTGNVSPVGRLDRASEGLLLLTDDGELAHRLTHPRYEVSKHYRVTITPALRDADGARLVAGVELDDGMARLLEIVLESSDGERSRLVVTVGEGRNRLIRRIFEQLGYSVRRLKRVQLGSLSLGKVALGEIRALRPAEVRELKRSVGIN
jgi:23S rRNA pseudouridine2605 synthase